MWIPICFLALALGASAAPYPYNSCNPDPQVIVLKQVTDSWSLPWTKPAPYFTCTYTFEIPEGTFAEVNLNATGAGPNDNIIAENIMRNNNDLSNSYQLTTYSPSKFEVTLTAGKDSTMSVQFSVNLQKVSSDVANSFRVISNDDSKLLYLDQWQEGTSYQVAADTLVRMGIAFNGVIDTRTQALLNNIFVYDGQNIPTTLLSYRYSYFLSKNKKISLYYAKKIENYDLQGALFLTDNSNLDGIEDHMVQFVPTNPSIGYSWATIIADSVYTPDARWGAVTIIGKADGSTPIDVRNINNISGNGTFLCAHGGPLPNHPNGKTFSRKDLPLHAVGVMNTIYLTQGDGSFKYTVY